MTIVCQRCQHANATRAAYCQNCGSTLTPRESDTAVSMAATDQGVIAIPAPGTVAISATPSEPGTVAISATPSDPSSTRRPREIAAARASMAAGPSLLVIAQDGSVSRSFPISVGQTDIGRCEGDILLPDDRFVCGRHARVHRDDGKVTIQDLASVNGIYKRVVNPVKLEPHDMFLIGLAVLKFLPLSPSEQNLACAVDRGSQVFGAPPSPRYAQLSEHTMEGISRSIFVLTREETILGREVGDIVFSSDPFMSRRHAAISRNRLDGSFSLVDLGSSNGTYVRIRGQVELAPGDHVRIGQHLFRYDLNNGQGQGQAQAR